MSFVIRPQKKDRLKPGWNTEKMLDWPTGAVSASRRYPGEPWKFVYEQDVLQAKRERMERALLYKRESGLSRHALYVWVFWCPGIGGFAFRGWWTYLIGIGQRYEAGGFKGDVADDLLSRIMQMFPVANPHPLLGPVSHYDWMSLFARKYQRGLWCGKPQGKAFVWATIKHGRYVLAINEQGYTKKSRPIK